MITRTNNMTMEKFSTGKCFKWAPVKVDLHEWHVSNAQGVDLGLIGWCLWDGQKFILK